MKHEVMMTIEIPQALYEELRKFCAEQGMSVQAFIVMAIQEQVDREKMAGKEAIAQ